MTSLARPFHAAGRSAIGPVCPVTALHSSGQECDGDSVPSNATAILIVGPMLSVGHADNHSAHIASSTRTTVPRPSEQSCDTQLL
jgi:hypothetical protein